ncbi:MAG: GGDEF domain-containing protein [Thiotrichales bacterium]|nr:MAG: GGDEF domain-containing protein [Thiotrichales bacterium]
MNAQRRIRLGLSDKISLTVIAVGVLGLVLVFYTSIYYRNIAYEHYQRSLHILATIKIEEILNDLKSDAADLARAIEQQPDFHRHIADGLNLEMARQLDEQFFQYFVTARIIDLAKLHVVDLDFNPLSVSNEGIATDPPSGLVCAELGAQARSRKGAERLQLISGTCNYNEHPMFVLISPFGGLKPEGYIQIAAHLASSLRQLEYALGMPVQIELRNGEVSYQSDEWSAAIDSNNHLPVVYNLRTHNDEHSVRVVLLADMTEFNQRVLSHRNWVMALATLAVAATVILILYILQSSTITPLSRIHKILSLINQGGGRSETDNRVLFAQLLENIITLQKNRKQRFAVMILDLDNFAAVNEQFGHDAGTELLKNIGERLSRILRETDIISWTGTDTPGHKLLPAGTKTEYRATLARLGGDEFGMLLPTVANEQQAVSVAKRIIDSLDSQYTIANQQVTLKCCVGISIYPDHGQQEQELIRNADKAMFQARQQAGKYCIYSAKTL